MSQDKTKVSRDNGIPQYSEYEKQARAFLRKFELDLVINEAKPQACPPWAKTGHRERPCDHVHGLHYRVYIGHGTTDVDGLRFNFWDSMNNQTKGKRPTAYDVLACISSDAYSPTDPDAVAEEYGDMEPSQAVAVAEHAAKLQKFFNRHELKALAEIQ